jgi:hypothetical protein
LESKIKKSKEELQYQINTLKPAVNSKISQSELEEFQKQMAERLEVFQQNAMESLAEKGETRKALVFLERRVRYIINEDQHDDKAAKQRLLRRPPKRLITLSDAHKNQSFPLRLLLNQPRPGRLPPGRLHLLVELPNALTPPRKRQTIRDFRGEARPETSLRTVFSEVECGLEVGVVGGCFD